MNKISKYTLRDIKHLSLEELDDAIKIQKILLLSMAYFHYSMSILHSDIVKIGNPTYEEAERNADFFNWIFGTDSTPSVFLHDENDMAEKSLEDYEEYTICVKALEVLKCDKGAVSAFCKAIENSYVRSRLGLEAFVMNKLPKIEGGKYFDCIFKPSLDLSAQAQILTKRASASVAPARDALAASPQNMFARPKAKSTNESFYSSKASSPQVEFLKRSVADKKSIRDEILQRCTKLSYLTAELKGCFIMLSNLLNEIHASLNSISAIESEGQTSLRGAIQAAADSQSIASEIEILKSKVEIAKAQSDVASKRFETLGKEAAQTKEKSLEDIKSLDKIVEELDKLE